MKKLSVAIFFIVGMMTLRAQHGGGSDMQANPWWVGLNAGLNTWVGNEDESDAHWDFGRAGWQIGIEVGRWMTPEWGLSLRTEAFSVHTPSRSFSAISALGTVTVDWTNIGGEVPGGLHLYTPLSIGAAFATDSNSGTSFVMSAAVGLRYGIGKMDLFGEAGLKVVGFGATALMPSLSLGVRFPLPSRKVVAYTPSNRSMLLDRKSQEEPRGLVDDMIATNEQLHLPVTVVRFSEESSTLDDNAFRHLNLFVSQVDASDWIADFYIIATADNSNESEKHNKKLCERRCQAVYDALVDDFGVNRYRLLLLPDGGYSEYAHQRSEQMVLIIQRTPETEEVVERWIPTY